MRVAIRGLLRSHSYRHSGQDPANAGPIAHHSEDRQANGLPAFRTRPEPDLRRTLSPPKAPEASPQDQSTDGELRRGGSPPPTDGALSARVAREQNYGLDFGSTSGCVSTEESSRLA